MTTALDLVTDALYKARILGAEDPLSNADAQLTLRVMNRMLDTWSNERTALAGVTYDTLTTVAGTASYSSSTLASGIRPVFIDSCYVTLSSVDYPVELVDNQTYQDQQYKPSRSMPRMLFANSTDTAWTFYFYPTPDAAYVVTLVVGQQFTTTPYALATTVSAPPGYEKAIVDNLAVEICSYFGAQADDAMVMDARSSRAILKRANYQPLLMDSVIGKVKTNIFTG